MIYNIYVHFCILISQWKNSHPSFIRQSKFHTLDRWTRIKKNDSYKQFGSRKKLWVHSNSWETTAASTTATTPIPTPTTTSTTTPLEIPTALRCLWLDVATPLECWPSVSGPANRQEGALFPINQPWLFSLAASSSSFSSSDGLSAGHTLLAQQSHLQPVRSLACCLRHRSTAFCTSQDNSGPPRPAGRASCTGRCWAR